MMTTITTLVPILAGLAASPSQSVSDTVVRSTIDRAPAARSSERAVDIVTDGPPVLGARSLREMIRARLSGDSVIEGSSASRAIGFRELHAARVILADGDSVSDAPSSAPSLATTRALHVLSPSTASAVDLVVSVGDLGPAIP